MQFRNSPVYQNIKNSPLIKMFIVFFAVLLVLAIVVSVTGNKPKKSASTGEYFDAGSGETVSDPAGKVVENSNETTPAPATLLGFSKLVSRGLLAGQLTEVNKQMQNFAVEQKPSITELSLATDSIVFSTPEEGKTTTVVTGKLTANRKDMYDLELSYDSLITIRTVVKKSNAVVFDSGVIDYYNVENSDE